MPETLASQAFGIAATLAGSVSLVWQLLAAGTDINISCGKVLTMQYSMSNGDNRMVVFQAQHGAEQQWHGFTVSGTQPGAVGHIPRLGSGRTANGGIANFLVAPLLTPWLPDVRRVFFILATLLLTTSCSSTRLAPQNFALWHFWHRSEVAALASYLEREGLADVLPISQLLRSASSWQECNAAPFAVPPQQRWEDVASVLRLMQHLESSGVLSGDIEVYSGYRNPDLNACAGGAAASAHVRTFALDFRVSGTDSPAIALCDFWRSKGKEWNMGFSIYPSGRIHIDTAGYRTWGYDHTGKSAVCSKA